MKNENNNAPPGDARKEEIMTVKELASALRVSDNLVYRLIAKGEIPGVQKVGSKIRIHRPTVIKWLARGEGRVSRQEVK